MVGRATQEAGISVPTYRLHDTTGDDLGLIEHPAPNVEPSDVAKVSAWLPVAPATKSRHNRREGTRTLQGRH